MSREQELGLDRNRKKFDVREEYFVSIFFLGLRFFYYLCFFGGESERLDLILSLYFFLRGLEAECGG